MEYTRRITTDLRCLTESALVIGAAALALAITAPAYGRSTLAKGLSLPPSGAYTPGEQKRPNAYDAAYGGKRNRDIVKEIRPQYVRLVINWDDVQPQAPPGPTAEDTYNQLHGDCGPACAQTREQFHRLDEQIKAANCDGVPVMLNVYHWFPTWTNQTTATDVECPNVEHTKPASQKLPAQLGEDSDWGRFIRFLIARYKPNQAAPSQVPQPYRDNPLHARIEGLEIMNEPNTLFWPQETTAAQLKGPGGFIRRIGDMIQTALAIADSEQFKLILAPTTNDQASCDGHGIKFLKCPDGSKRRQFIAHQEFTKYVAQDLDRRARSGSLKLAHTRLLWSHHNYCDIKANTKNPQSSRAAKALSALHDALVRRCETDPTKICAHSRDCPGHSACRAVTKPALYLTEGGFHIDPKHMCCPCTGKCTKSTHVPCSAKEQACSLLKNYQRMKSLNAKLKQNGGGQIKLWTQYKLHDTCGDSKYHTGLFEDFVYSPPEYFPPDPPGNDAHCPMTGGSHFGARRDDTYENVAFHMHQSPLKPRSNDPLCPQ